MATGRWAAPPPGCVFVATLEVVAEGKNLRLSGRDFPGAKFQRCKNSGNFLATGGITGSVGKLLSGRPEQGGQGDTGVDHDQRRSLNAGIPAWIARSVRRVVCALS